jgi:GPH family glycoside/pentoside/hexuronide:cation symporter
MFLTSALQTYMFKDYFQNTSLITVSGLLGMASSFIIMPMTGKLVAKFGKREVATYTLLITIAANAAMFFLPLKNVYLYIGLCFISSFGGGFFNMLVWALVGDCIDYQEYISGKRDEAVLYASYSLVRKLVQAIVGGISGFALAVIGYQSGVATQAPEVLAGIKNIATGVPFVAYTIGFLGMLFIYNLSKSKLEEITNELNARRAN